MMIDRNFINFFVMILLHLLLLLVLPTHHHLVSGQVSTSQIEYFEFAKKTYGKNLTAFAAELGLDGFERNFTDFKRQFRKEYWNPDDIEYRKTNYLYSLKMIRDNEVEFQSGKVGYRLKVNKFADFGLDENFFISQKSLKARYKAAKKALPVYGKGYERPNASSVVFPANFDWRSRGVVSPVEDQGPCGSCWIFAGLTVVEGANAIVNNPLVSLSKQQIMDCVTPPFYISDGCSGGTVEDVYSYARHIGITTNQTYPYNATRGTCRNVVGQWREWVRHWNFLPLNSSDEEIMWVIYNKGPVAAIINAGDRHLQLYSSGVLTSLGDRDLEGDYNHYVTIVGWGNDNGLDFWIVKNSWGTEWGEDGYIRLSRGRNNRGINTVVSYAEASPLQPPPSPPPPPTPPPPPPPPPPDHAHHTHQTHSWLVIMALLVILLQLVTSL